MISRSGANFSLGNEFDHFLPGASRTNDDIWQLPRMPKLWRGIPVGAVFDKGFTPKLYFHWDGHQLSQDVKWFMKGGDCHAKRKSIMQNVQNHQDIGNTCNEVLASLDSKIPSEALEEFNKIRFKKPNDGPKFSPGLLSFFIVLHITTGIQVAAWKICVESLEIIK